MYIYIIHILSIYYPYIYILPYIIHIISYQWAIVSIAKVKAYDSTGASWGQSHGTKTNLGPTWENRFFGRGPSVRLPSGKLTQLWKFTIFNGKIHSKWQFSIAMLVYQRVHDRLPLFAIFFSFLLVEFHVLLVKKNIRGFP